MTFKRSERTHISGTSGSVSKFRAGRAKQNKTHGGVRTTSPISGPGADIRSLAISIGSQSRRIDSVE